MPLTMRKKLMQRLSSWLDQLPLPRRGQTREPRARGLKAASRSAAPTVRLPPPRVAPPPPPAPLPSSYGDPWEPRLTRGAAASGRRLLEDAPMGGSLSQATTRQTIRTNPWISRSSLRASSHCSASRLPMTTSTTSSSGVSSLSPSASSTASSPYGVVSSGSRLKLDESMCSSGYGSHGDESPESSVHSPNWHHQPPLVHHHQQLQQEDKAIECRSIDLDAELGFLEETSSFGPYDEMGCESDDKEMEMEEDEHVYHELESVNGNFARVVAESRVPSSLSSGSISLPRPQKSFLPPRSPVYARPFEGGPNYARTVEINNREYVMPGSLPNSYYTSYSPKPRGDFVSSAFPTRRPRQLPLAPWGETGAPVAAAAAVYARPARPRFTAPPPPPYEEEVWRQKEATVEEAALRKIEQDFLAELDAQIQELQVKSEAVRCLVDEARVRRAGAEEWRRARWHNTFELCL